MCAGAWLIRMREIIKTVPPCAQGHGLYICIECHINGGSRVRAGTWRNEGKILEWLRRSGHGKRKPFRIALRS